MVKERDGSCGSRLGAMRGEFSSSARRQALAGIERCVFAQNKGGTAITRPFVTGDFFIFKEENICLRN